MRYTMHELVLIRESKVAQIYGSAFFSAMLSQHTNEDIPMEKQPRMIQNYTECIYSYMAVIVLIVRNISKSQVSIC